MSASTSTGWNTIMPVPEQTPTEQEFEGWLLDPLYPVRWKELPPIVIIDVPPPTTDKKDKQKKTWIEIRLVTDSGDPIPNEKFILYMPDGSAKNLKLNNKGRYRLENIDPGNYTVSFPDIGYTIPVTQE